MTTETILNELNTAHKELIAAMYIYSLTPNDYLKCYTLAIISELNKRIAELEKLKFQAEYMAMRERKRGVSYIEQIAAVALATKDKPVNYKPVKDARPRAARGQNQNIG